MENRLPKNIKQKVLDYLLLEYDEGTNHGDLQLNDLTYEGEKMVDALKCHCWGFPSLRSDMWVTLVVDIDGEMHFSIATKPSNDGVYNRLFIEVDGIKAHKESFEYIYEQDSNLSCVDDRELKIHGAGSIRVSSEIYFTPSPPQISITLVYEGKEYRMQGGVGLFVSFPLDGDREVHVEVGDLDKDWE